MKNRILVTIILLILVGKLFTDVSDKRIKFSPFVYFEKNVFSTLKIEHELDYLYTHKKIEISMVDHISVGCKIQKSFYFAVLNNMLSLNNFKTNPIYFDLNAGINYRNYSAYLGRVLNMKRDDTEMLETTYFGISSNWRNKKSDFLCNLQFIDGNYTNCLGVKCDRSRFTFI